MKRKIMLLAAPLAIALIAAGCGGSANYSGTSSGPYGSAMAAGAGSGSTATVKVGTVNSPLGRILVDGKGRTLYLFEKDMGRASACYGACAGIWPPVTVKGTPAAGNGVRAGSLGTTKRADGSLGVTYAGHPLYYYAGDASTGDTKGEGLDQFGAEWYVLAPSGRKIDRD